MKQMKRWSLGRGPTAKAEGYPADGDGEPPSADCQQPDQEAISAFLRKYGYGVTTEGVSACAWETADAPGGDSIIRLELHVSGHEELDGHTWYRVDCSLSSVKMRPFNWQMSCRLTQLRDDLHDPVKAALAKRYDEYFAKSPFAHMGGPRGTTARLDGWCSALADCINAKGVKPAIVNLVLHFVEVPPPPSIVGNTKSAASSAMSKLKDKITTAKDSAKESAERAQIDATQKFQATTLKAAKANPKLAQSASGAGLNFAKQNPKLAQTAAVAGGGIGLSAFKQNPKMAFSAAKLVAKANLSRS